MIFVEILKNTNNTFESLPQMTNSAEMKTRHVSNEIVRKYFKARNMINDACSCMSVPNRPHSQH